MIVFPHLPKSGGTSFRKSLQLHYGDRFLQCHFPPRPNVRDRRQQRLAVIENRLIGYKIDRKYDVVYGHFCADIYRGWGRPVCMFFREPTRRLLSEWHYHRSMGRDVGDLLEYAQRPRQQQIYKLFLGGQPVEELAFVGLTEHYAESIRLFEEIFSIKLNEQHMRVGRYDRDDDLLDQVRPFEAENIRFYDAARRRFDELHRKYL